MVNFMLRALIRNCIRDDTSDAKKAVTFTPAASSILPRSMSA